VALTCSNVKENKAEGENEMIIGRTDGWNLEKRWKEVNVTELPTVRIVQVCCTVNRVYGRISETRHSYIKR
jgi:hypothetical protein